MRGLGTAGPSLHDWVTGTARRLTSDDTDAAYPRWSPDGHSILFTWNSSAGADLAIVSAAGGTPRLALKHDAGTWTFEGDWSPDGTQIVYKVYQSGWNYNQLRLASADGTNQRELWTGVQSTAETPHWGP